MGQHASKHHAPLTFGYVNRSEGGVSVEQVLDRDEDVASDFILNNPHLYKLEMTCNNRCAERTEGFSEPNKDLVSSDTVIAATVVDQECEHCQQNKRLSLVRKDLAKDLEYVDQTYYPDVVHYTPSTDDPLENELLRFGLQDTLEEPDSEEETDSSWAKLTIGDIAPGVRRPRRLTSPSTAVDLSGKSLIKLSPSVGFLNNLTKLTLSHNQMTALPPELGYLKNLRVLNAAYNQLETLPDTIAFLGKLKALNVSNNQIRCLPSSIGLLPKLVIVILNDNKLVEIPRELANLSGLISLNISNNPLNSIPAEIGTLKSLRKLNAEGCEFLEEAEYDLRHDPPSLFETCARTAIRAEIPVPGHISDRVKDYLATSQTCSYCRGPYFDACVVRYRFVERVLRQTVALEYKLCCAHWGDEDDRLVALFSRPSVVHATEDDKTIDMDGLQSPTLRSRAFSESSRSLSGLSALSLSPSMSSQVSRTTNTSISTVMSDLDASPIPIRMLKRQPSLPALPQHNRSTTMSSLPSSPLATTRRPRASSSASVTRRIAGFLSPPQNARFARSFSNSSLLRYQVNEDDAAPMHRVEEQDAEFTEPRNELNSNRPVSDRRRSPEEPLSISPTPLDEEIANHGQRNAPFGNGVVNTSPQAKTMLGGRAFRAGLAHIGARLTRDRSGTV